MYYSDNVNKIDFSFYEFQIDMILRALELYAYNLHYVGRKSCDEYELSNIILLYLYNDILSRYSNNRFRSAYNPSVNCQNEISRIKKQNIYYKKNFYKKVS